MHSKFSRRNFLKLTAATAASGRFLLFPERASAAQKKLSIAKWAHFVPEFDPWFEGMAAEWGKQHDTQVVVDRIPAERIHADVGAEIEEILRVRRFLDSRPAALLRGLLERGRHAPGSGALRQPAQRREEN